MDRYLKMGQGPAKLASEEDLQRDENGYTNPNLHRRSEPEDPPTGDSEVLPREYKFSIHDVNGFQTTIKTVHDEESTTSEIP